MSNSLLVRLRALVPTVERFVTPAAQLITRLVFGQSFVLTGLGKLQNLDRTTAFFADLGIPLPSLQAPMIGTLELVGGALLMLGLGTRISAALLTCTMLVALATAHLAQLPDALTFAESFDSIAPLPYLVATLWLLAKGAGSLSVDRFFAVVPHRD